MRVGETLAHPDICPGDHAVSLYQAGGVLRRRAETLRASLRGAELDEKGWVARRDEAVAVSRGGEAGAWDGVEKYDEAEHGNAAHEAVLAEERERKEQGRQQKEQTGQALQAAPLGEGSGSGSEAAAVAAASAKPAAPAAAPADDDDAHIFARLEELDLLEEEAVARGESLEEEEDDDDEEGAPPPAYRVADGAEQQARRTRPLGAGGGGVAAGAPFPMMTEADVAAFEEYKRLMARKDEPERPQAPAQVQTTRPPASLQPQRPPRRPAAPGMRPPAPPPSSPFDYSKWDHIEGLSSDEGEHGDSDDESEDEEDLRLSRAPKAHAVAPSAQQSRVAPLVQPMVAPRGPAAMVVRERDPHAAASPAAPKNKRVSRFKAERNPQDYTPMEDVD